MTRKKLQEKYSEVLKAMYKVTGDDSDVCLDKLIFANNKKHGRETGTDEYIGIPQNFDYEAFEADYQEMVNAEKGK